jgi:hypothetical protein
MSFAVSCHFEGEGSDSHPVIKENLEIHPQVNSIPLLDVTDLFCFEDEDRTGVMYFSRFSSSALPYKPSSCVVAEPPCLDNKLSVYVNQIRDL